MSVEGVQRREADSDSVYGSLDRSLGSAPRCACGRKEWFIRGGLATGLSTHQALCYENSLQFSPS
jgi:hypothetical protein